MNFLTTVAIVTTIITTAGAQNNRVTQNEGDQAKIATQDWIKNNHIPIFQVEPEHGFLDLNLLKPVLKGKKIVALGESTHGTREFFQMKHRLLEFLVKKMGFKVFVIEASYSASIRSINQYVLHGIGSLDEVLASQGFWIWDTQEMKSMIEWMRKYNQTVADNSKIKFLGCDLQINAQAYTVIKNYIQKTAPEKFTSIDSLLLLIENRESEKIFPPDSTVAQWIMPVKELQTYLIMNKGGLVLKSSEVEFESTLIHLRLILQWLEVFSKGHFHGEGNRDWYMAENMKYLISREKEDTKFIFWAHNSHIGKSSRYKRTGYYLRQAFGDDYYSIAFDFYEGGFQSREYSDNKDGDLKEFIIHESPNYSLPGLFVEAGIEKGFIDLRGAPSNVVWWLDNKAYIHSSGSRFNNDWSTREKHFATFPFKMAEEFDGVLFIRKTSRSRPNPSGMRYGK